MSELRFRFRRHLSDTLYANSYYLIFGSAASALLGMVFWVVATRTYSPETIGLASTLIAALTLLSVFSNLGLGIGLIRFLPAAKEDAGRMINTVISLSMLASGILSLSFIAGISIWSPALESIFYGSFIPLLFVILALSWNMNYMLYCIFLAKRIGKYTLTQNVLTNSLKLVLLVVLLSVYSDFLGILLASGIAMGVSVVLGLGILLPSVLLGYRYSPMIDRRVLSEIGRYSLGNFASRIFLDTLPLILSLAIINILGSVDTAYFNIVWSLTSLLIVIPSSIFNSLFAEGSAAPGLLQSNSKKAIRFFLVTMTPAVGIVMFFAPQILLLFGESYSENGATIMRLMALSMMFFGANYYFLTMARIRMEIGGTLIPIATAMATALSVVALISSMGLVGIGISFLVGQATVAIPLLAVALFSQMRSRIF